MRFTKPLCLGFIAVTALGCPAHPQDADQSLRLYAVRIIRVPKEPWTGYGIYLGNGIVITAAHVAGRAPWRRLLVEIAGQNLPADVLKKGRFSDVDLTLLSVEQRQLPVGLRLRRMTVCKDSPSPGEEVIVAIPEGIARSHVILPSLLPHDLAPKFRTAISDVATTGNSGSGIFDANKKCLLGIISAKIQASLIRQENGHAVRESHDIAKYFVPARTIADFIPPEYRF
jgi:trypsin-like peptidase